MKVIECDLFDAPVDAIAHGCNMAGVMGAGIAKQWKRYFPLGFERYAETCKNGEFELGSWLGFVENGYVGFNLSTQRFPGPHADPEAIGTALGSVASFITKYNLNISTIGIPRIGCGLGGLEWEVVERWVIAVEGRFPEIEFVVCDLPKEKK